VAPVAAFDVIVAAAAEKRVVSAAAGQVAEQDVVAAAAVDEIVAAAALEPVGSRSTEKLIVCRAPDRVLDVADNLRGAADPIGYQSGQKIDGGAGAQRHVAEVDRVVAVLPDPAVTIDGGTAGDEEVVAVLADQRIPARAVAENVIAVGPEQDVVAGIAVQRVVAGAAEKEIIAVTAEQPIVAAGAVQRVAERAAAHHVVAAEHLQDEGGQVGRHGGQRRAVEQGYPDVDVLIVSQIDLQRVDLAEDRRVGIEGHAGADGADIVA